MVSVFQPSQGDVEPVGDELSIIATPGAADANSYVTLAEADLLASSMVKDDDVVLWDDTSDDDKSRALWMATQRIDRELFLGARTNDTQALEWPRIGVKKPGSYVNVYTTGFPFRTTQRFFADNEIPDQIKKAQTFLAVYLNNNRGGLGLSGLEDYKNVQVGPLNVTPDKYGAVGADRIPPIIQRYLQGIRIGGPGSISVRRS